MELTDLKQIANSGGNVTSTIGNQQNSKTLQYKQVNNSPKFENGTLPTGIDTSGITPNVYSQTTYGMPSVKQYFSSPAATVGAKSISAPIIPSTRGKGGGFNTSLGSKGGGFNVSGIGGVVTSGVQFAGDAINSFSVNETGEEIANRQGNSGMSIGGISYDSPNMINVSEELDRVKKENTGNTLKTVGSGAALGAAAGSIIPGLGTAAGALIGGAVGLFTGIFGGEARKREYRRMLAKQNSKINSLQDSARYSAQTKAMQLYNAKEYGNSESQYLYGAKEGKQPEVNPNTGITKDDFLLATPNGYKIGKANSLVEPGETLFDTKTGSMMQVPRQIGSKLHPGDIQPAEIPEYAAVFTDRHEDPNTGKSFAQAAIDGDDDPYNLLYRQKVLVNDKKNNKGLMKAKNGRLPKFDNGWVGNAITSGLGALGGLSQWLEAKNSTPRRTNSYRSNPYEQEALSTLASLDTNPYPIMQQLRNAEARTGGAIDMSGGLTTGQRTLTRLAGLYGTQQNIANAMAALQDQRNKYKSNYASSALNAGQADRQAMTQAYQWDEDMYAKAHAARQQGMQVGTYNILNALQQYYANEFKYNQFNDIMSLYRDDQKIKRDELQALLNNNSLAKNMQSYTKKQMANHLISRAATNPIFNPTKVPSYRNITGKWLVNDYLKINPNGIRL